MNAKLPHLNRLMKYKNESVIERYMKEYGRSRKNANRNFSELMKFFWLFQRAKIKGDRVQCGIYPSMLQIDEMWHTFLLFTKDYTNFCKDYFGCFIHHIPETSKNVINEETKEENLNIFLSYAYDHLGEKTVRYWFKV